MSAYTQTVYRDTKTGRLVSKEKWQRSKSHGGKRYKRERIKHEEEENIETWIITFKYPAE